MKQIFEDIAEESMVLVPGAKGLHTRTFSLERFAELIVLECVTLVQDGGEFCSRPKLVEKIQTHFGIIDV